MKLFRASYAHSYRLLFKTTALVINLIGATFSSFAEFEGL
jgi:hypothetical protein